MNYVNVASIFSSKRKLVRAHGGALSVSVLNQGISSGINFLVGIYLARVLVPYEFGIYGIGFSFVLLYAGLCNALFTTQMVVKLPGRKKEDQSIYVANILRILSGFCFAFLAIVLLSLLLLAACGINVFQAAVAASVLAAVGYVFKDFFVRLAYSHFREKVALAINSSIAIATALCFALAHFLSIELTAVTAICIYAVGQFAGAALGILSVRLPLREHRASSFRTELGDTWRDGRWSLGGALVIWIQSQAYVYVSVLTLGPMGVGYANAAKLFISPFMFLSPAINQLMLPRLSAMRVDGVERVHARARLYSSMMMSASLLYVLGVYIGFDFIRSAIFGEKYNAIGLIVAAWGGMLVLQMFREGASTSLQALVEFRAIFLRNFVSATVVCVLAMMLSARFGVFGAVSALALGELLLGLLLWGRLKQLSRSNLQAHIGEK